MEEDFYREMRKKHEGESDKMYAVRCKIEKLKIEIRRSKNSYDLGRKLGDYDDNDDLCFMNHIRELEEKLEAAREEETEYSKNEDVRVENYFKERIHVHQKKVASLPSIDEARTVLWHSSRGVLSTFSQNPEGYPSESVVEIACDNSGSPILVLISGIHTQYQDLKVNSRCSLLVMKDQSDVAIIVHGDAVFFEEQDANALRTAYLERHPEHSNWVEAYFGVEFLQIEPRVVRYVTAQIVDEFGELSKKEFEFSKDAFVRARVDPIYGFSKLITSEMNKDRREEIRFIVQHSLLTPVDFAYMLDVDSFGFRVKVGYREWEADLRIPFARRALDRRDVKKLLAEMFQAAKVYARQLHRWTS